MRPMPVLILALAALLTIPGPAAAASPADPGRLLADWVADFRSDPSAAKPIRFGVRIRDAAAPDWHVVVAGVKGPDSLWTVTLKKGFPEDPSAFFITDMATLLKLHSGEMASLTAMGKAFSTDFAPLDIEITEGYAPDPETVDHLVRLSFHFWTRGTPEIVRFGNLDHTRVLHGANATLFYYQEGFRSGWFSVGKGQHVNAEEASKTNPFPTLLIVTSGRMTANIGGKEIPLEQGQSMYIGPDVRHEFWNDSDVRAEGIIIMFGKGA